MNTKIKAYRTIMQRLRTYIIKKIPILLFLISIFIFGYCILIFFDEAGPTSEYDTKEIRISETLNGVGSYSINGEYKSKGVVSANKEIELNIIEVAYTVQRDYLKSKSADTVPDNITVRICPDNAVFGNLGKSPCIDVILEKSGQDYSPISYHNYPEIKYNIAFPYSGQMALTMLPLSTPLQQIRKEKVFEIEPYSTYLQIKLQKYMYILALFGIIVILFQIFEFGIKIFKKL